MILCTSTAFIDGYLIKKCSSPTILKPLESNETLNCVDPKLKVNRRLRKNEFVIKPRIGYFNDFNVYD